MRKKCDSGGERGRSRRRCREAELVHTQDCPVISSHYIKTYGLGTLPHREQPSTNPVTVHPKSIRSPPPSPVSWAGEYLPPDSISYMFFPLSPRRRRIIFGYVPPLLVFTGYPGAKKIPSRKKKGVYEEVKMNGSHWNNPREIVLKILFIGAFKAYIVT